MKKRMNEVVARTGCDLWAKVMVSVFLWLKYNVYILFIHTQHTIWNKPYWGTDRHNDTCV